MKLPIQSAPVMRGHDRVRLPPCALDRAVTPSQAAPPSSLCGLCNLLPPPYNTICQAVCGGIHF